MKKKIVYVCMSADILHAGHINILERASRLGNVVVGLMTDQAISYYKKIPFLNYYQREIVIRNLNMVQEVVPQNTMDYRPNLKKIKPDFVIHLAAYVGGLFKNMNFKVDMYEKNTLMNCNVLKCCHEIGVKKLVSCLSTCIFPDKTTYPINESMLHNGPPHSSNDAYAYAKRMLEVQSKAYQEQYKDNFICVIPTNIYGENDNYSLEGGHVIPALIHKCYLAKQNKEKFVVRGTGKPLRQFIYSTDLAKLIMWVLESYDEKDSIILSVSEEEEMSIGDVARLVSKEFDYEHMMTFDD